jgi:hypothetical protein
MGAPHRPNRYLEAAKAAQEKKYDCLLIDSWTMEWRGVGGVLDWMDEEINAAVERQKATAEQRGWTFNEAKARLSNRAAGQIRPKMAHRLTVAGFLDVRIPVIFAIRGEMTFDPDTNKEKFKAQCAPSFPYEVTVSFRLAADKKGIIDLSDKDSWKMEGPHAAIFKHGEQLSERHGEMLAAWARGETTSTVSKGAANAAAHAPDTAPATAPGDPQSGPPASQPASTEAPKKSLGDLMNELLDEITQCETPSDLDSFRAARAKELAGLKTHKPVLHTEIEDAIAGRIDILGAQS